MPRRITKRLQKAQEQFKAAVTEYIIGLGARPGRFYDHELDTPAGLLYVTVYEDWVACRYDDVERGKGFTESCGRPCNPYSGKWNFHFGDGTVEALSPERVLQTLTYYFESLMAWKGGTA